MTHPLRLIGHRGACAERPENTLSSFERAVEIGVDVLETDVHMTADGVVVVSHDEDGTRSAGVSRRISETSLAELSTWDVGQGMRIPTLDALLDRFPDAELNIDIKQRRPPMVDAFLAVIRNHQAMDRVQVASFHVDVIREVRKRFDGATVLAQNETLKLVVLPLAILRRFPLPGNAVQVPLRAGPFDLASRAFIDKCHTLGFRVDYWTVNDPIVAEVLIDRGANGMITDDPARLKPVFDRLR